jgi:cytochrome c-type biogenesis protein CcmE
MNGFYIRWAIILSLGAGLFFLGLMRYREEVRTVSPEALLRHKPGGTVRLLGTVVPGTLEKPSESGNSGGSGEIRFTLKWAESEVPVRYSGDDPENLRDLKTLVIRGRLDKDSQVFQGDQISVVPNYGFITAAYIVGVLPLALFLFAMERRVRLLYREIKGTNVYEPEKVFDKE